MAALLIILTIALPWIGGLLVWWLGGRRSNAQHLTAIGFSLAAAVASLLLLFVTTSEVAFALPMGALFGDFTFIPDGLGVFMAIIATAIGCSAVVFSKDYMRGDPELGRYYSLVLLFIGAMAGLVLTGSLLALFLFWEITAFCSYALISFHNDDPKAVHGGIKALIITQLGGVGLLVGALAIFSKIGSYQIGDFLARFGEFDSAVLAMIGFTFLFAAIAKSAQVPLQTWLPDAMEAPTPVSALIHAATMVNAGVYLLIRFYPSLKGVPGWTDAVIVVGLLSALIGGLHACFTDDLKRALAYSTISQLGYMVYAIGVGAIFAGQFHLLNHSIFKALLFLCAGAVIHSLDTRDMRMMGGLRKKMPFVFWTFLVGALALAGIPLANGFFSKEMILEHGLEAGPQWTYFGMVLATAMTGLYSTRMVGMVFFGRPAKEPPHLEKQSAMYTSLGVLGVGVLSSWVIAGGFSRLLLGSLPFHDWHHAGTVQIMTGLFLNPVTWMTLLVIACSSGVWILLHRHGAKIDESMPLVRFIQTGLGFERVNHGVVTAADNLSNAVRITQTGQLQWNLLGILAAMVLVLCITLLGA
jgi:NADH-quinone oxidoreductase subunit L